MKNESCLEAEYQLPVGVEILVGENKYKSLILREVVGLDEEAISQPVYKDNPPAMIIELIYRCIAEVPGAERLPSKKEIKSLPVGVLDSLVMEIRKLSVGDEIPFTAVCPAIDKEGNTCGQKDELVSLLSEIKMKPGSYELKKIPLERGVAVEGKKLKVATIKCPDGFLQDQFSKQKDTFRFGEMSTDFIHACLVDIDGVKIDKATVSNMARIDRKKLSDEIKKFPGPDTTANAKCSKCGKNYEVPLVIFDFLV